MTQIVVKGWHSWEIVNTPDGERLKTPHATGVVWQPQEVVTHEDSKKNSPVRVNTHMHTVHSNHCQCEVRGVIVVRNPEPYEFGFLSNHAEISELHFNPLLSRSRRKKLAEAYGVPSRVNHSMWKHCPSPKCRLRGYAIAFACVIALFMGLASGAYAAHHILKGPVKTTSN